MMYPNCSKSVYLNGNSAGGVDNEKLLCTKGVYHFHSTHKSENLKPGFTSDKEMKMSGPFIYMYFTMILFSFIKINFL